MITEQQAKDIRAREEALRAFLGKRRSYRTEEVEHLNPPTNDERSALEVFEFHRDKPMKYFLYINEEKKLATTWTGEELGKVSFGRPWRDNFGGERQHVWIHAITGDAYHGVYYRSAGNYARVRR
jgi:hypothetical protein